MILGSVSLIGLWILGALSRRLAPRIGVALAVGFVVASSLGLIGAASPRRESIPLRLLGALLSLGGLILGVLFVIGMGG